MTKSVITKTLRKLESTTEEYSKGFKRYFVLPERVKYNIGLAYYLETGSINDNEFIMSFFENMTEKEYKNYLAMA